MHHFYIYSMEENIYNFKRQYERMLIRIGESIEISEENKKTILKFDKFLLSENISIARTLSYLHYSIQYAKMLQKPFSEANIDDIRGVIARLNQTPLSENTKKGFKITLKRLYRFIEGITRTGVYPEKVEWIKATISNNNKKLPEELLTNEEILKIIQKCDNLRDKTLISTLAESGARISEIALMKIKHVSFEKSGAKLTIDGKTGMRKILVVTSSIYLQDWINRHPGNNNLESYLWSNSDGKPLCHARILAILKKAVEKAEVKKKVYPHLFRHSRATFLASKLKDASLKYYFGWAQGSNMASIYIHMSGECTDDAILELNGIKPKEQETKSELEPKKCFKCNVLNEPTNICCKACGISLNKDEADRIIKSDIQRQIMDNFMEKLILIPKIKRLLLKEAKKIRETQ